MGEVTLVVVGILIALQVNNWNEGRKEDRLAAAYTAGVAADLDRDAAAIRDYLAYVQRELEAHEGYRARLAAPTATVDTLFRIARYEFAPVADQLPAFHDNTFKSIQSSGNLQLLEPWLGEALVELDRLQRWALDVEEVVNTLYYHTAVAYRYPLGGEGFFGEGPLSELLWEAIEPAELAVRFQRNWRDSSGSRCSGRRSCCRRCSIR